MLDERHLFLILDINMVNIVLVIQYFNCKLLIHNFITNLFRFRHQEKLIHPDVNELAWPPTPNLCKKLCYVVYREDL